MIISAFAAVVIFSIQPLQNSDHRDVLHTHTCNGNHSATRKLLKLRQLKKGEIGEVRQLADADTKSCCTAVESHVRKKG
jgi:hypothetical protein